MTDQTQNRTLAERDLSQDDDLAPYVETIRIRAQEAVAALLRFGDAMEAFLTQNDGDQP